MHVILRSSPSLLGFTSLQLSVEKSSKIVQPVLLYCLWWRVQRIQNDWCISLIVLLLSSFELKDNAYRTLPCDLRTGAFTSPHLHLGCLLSPSALAGAAEPLNFVSTIFEIHDPAISQASAVSPGLELQPQVPASFCVTDRERSTAITRNSKIPRSRTIIVVTRPSRSHHRYRMVRL